MSRGVMPPLIRQAPWAATPPIHPSTHRPQPNEPANPCRNCPPTPTQTPTAPLQGSARVHKDKKGDGKGSTLHQGHHGRHARKCSAPLMGHTWCPEPRGPLLHCPHHRW